MAAPEPLKRGYDVDENAIRFSNYFHVLRELVHLSAGWLPHFNLDLHAAVTAAQAAPEGKAHAAAPPAC